MNAIVPAERRAAEVRKLEMSPALAEAVALAIDYAADGHKCPWPITPAVAAEAGRALAAIEDDLLPSGAPAVAWWLGKVNLGLDRPITTKEFETRVGSIADAVASVPRGALSWDTVREAQRTMGWFPGAKAVTDFLAPHARKLYATRRALESIAGHKPSPKSEKPASAEERDRIADAFRAKFAPLAQGPAMTVEDQIAAMGRERPAAAHLAGEDLAAARAAAALSS